MKQVNSKAKLNNQLRELKNKRAKAVKSWEQSRIDRSISKLESLIDNVQEQEDY